MSTILLQVSLTPSELDHLRQEFPNYLFLLLNREEIDKLSPESWSHIEVIYGSYLLPSQLIYATELRWIYSPGRQLDELPLAEIKKRGNIIVTIAEDEGALQISEFVMAVTLNFAKKIPYWSGLNVSSSTAVSRIMEKENNKWQELVWSLPKRIFLQVGLGTIGRKIAEQAHQMGLTIHGAMTHRGFHPNCSQIFDYDHLSEAVEKADIVSVYLPVVEESVDLIGLKVLKAMKQDSILILVGSHQTIDLKALQSVASSDKWRGVWLDLYDIENIPKNSPLWEIPNIIISPGIANLPKTSGKHLFQSFHYSLRQYVVGNFGDVKIGNFFR